MKKAEAINEILRKLRKMERELGEEIKKQEERIKKISGFTIAKCRRGSGWRWQAYGYSQGQRIVVSLGKSLAAAEEKIADAKARMRAKIAARAYPTWGCKCCPSAAENPQVCRNCGKEYVVIGWSCWACDAVFFGDAGRAAAGTCTCSDLD